MGPEKEQLLTMHGLKSAAGFIQTKLADRLTSRYVPHVTFVLDDGVKKSIEIGRLIREETERLAAANPSAETDPTATPESDEDEDETDTDIDPPDAPIVPPTASATGGPGAASAEGSTDRPKN